MVNEIMFIRKITNAQKKTYYHLVESYREGKRVRHRTLYIFRESR